MKETNTNTVPVVSQAKGVVNNAHEELRLLFDLINEQL